MRVNSALKSVFIHRMVLRINLLVAILAIGMCAISGSALANNSGNTCVAKANTPKITVPPGRDRELRAKQTNLLIREIGHRLLLQAGDSTSLVLPVTEIKEGTFLLGFENESLFFSHDSLVTLTERFLPRGRFPSGYTVTVHDCLTSSITYGYQISSNSADAVACKGRRQPSGCYSIEIDFPDLYQENERENIVITTPSKKESEVEVKIKANEIDAGVTSIPPDHQEENSLREQLNKFQPAPEDANVKHDAVKTSSIDSPLMNWVYGGMMLLVSVSLLIGRFRKKTTAVVLPAQNDSVQENAVPELPSLGKLRFDVKNQQLLLGDNVVSLTDKECRILELLNENFGELIPRETLIQKIWIDEGVITGRSLDMFVSKLRKKLSIDPDLKIMNVHGKGYKLVTGH